MFEEKGKSFSLYFSKRCFDFRYQAIEGRGKLTRILKGDSNFKMLQISMKQFLKKIEEKL